MCEAAQVRNPGVPVLIPAYMPGSEILALVKGLLQLGVSSIVVVDDGSGARFEELFRDLASLDRVHVIHHAINLGKGAALKTGLNQILVHTPGCIGAVTADADGQHHPEDIVRVAARLRQDPGALIMGVREFGPHVPGCSGSVPSHSLQRCWIMRCLLWRTSRAGILHNLRSRRGQWRWSSTTSGPAASSFTPGKAIRQYFRNMCCSCSVTAFFLLF